jgi:phage gpG-like protein
MAKILFRVDDGGAKAKLAALEGVTQNMAPVFETVGRVLINRIRLCFKLGIDPWNNPWAAIKYRAPRVKMRAIKDAGGNVIDYKQQRDKDGRLVLTKVGRGQVAANRSVRGGGSAGQPLRDTGRLNRSITSKADGQGVTVGTNVKYAPTHQFGAIIRPKNPSKFLVFPGPDGEKIFAKKVTIPARPFLPLRRNTAVVALPPAWSVLVVNAIKLYFRKEVAKAVA